MIISWLGLSSFKISSGNLTLVTDPFSKTVGLTPPRMQTDIAVISNIKNEIYNNTESLGGDDKFVIDGPGEFDVKSIFLRGLAAQGDEKARIGDFDYTTIYAIHMEDIKIGFLGSLKQKELSDEQIEALGEIDILLVPVGGHAVCDPEEAVKVVSQIEPKIVVPMHYAQKGLKLNLEKGELFMKELGEKETAAQDRLTIKKSAFAEGAATQIVLLEPQR